MTGSCVYWPRVKPIPSSGPIVLLALGLNPGTFAGVSVAPVMNSLWKSVMALVMPPERRF